MPWIIQTAETFWDLSQEMAPYLLLGFACAALLRCWVTDAFVRRHLGQRGWQQTLKASFIGVPLPLCSCGIIPVAASLHKQGGSAGAVAAFTASTPQTGVDSILATGALLSWPFALVRVVVAFFSGALAGIFVDRFAVPTVPKPSQTEANSCCGGGPQAPAEMKPCCSSPPPETSPRPSFAQALRFGFVRLPSDIGGSLLLGLLIAAVLTVAIPGELADSTWTNGFLAYLITTAAAIPLYVCSTGSIPMAYGLLHAGFSPGAALIFLIAGPATNTATITALVRMLGSKAVFFYLLAIILSAWISAAIIDQIGGLIPLNHGHEHAMAEAVWWKTVSALILYLLLLQSCIEPLIKLKRKR